MRILAHKKSLLLLLLCSVYVMLFILHAESQGPNSLGFRIRAVLLITIKRSCSNSDCFPIPMSMELIISLYCYHWLVGKETVICAKMFKIVSPKSD